MIFHMKPFGSVSGLGHQTRREITKMAYLELEDDIRDVKYREKPVITVAGEIEIVFHPRNSSVSDV